MASDHTLIFYDMRNRGHSDTINEREKLSGGIHLDVEDLETIRRYFDIQKTSLIGWSYLGLMVVLYSTAYQDRTTRIVQIGPMQFNTETKYPESLRVNDDSSVPDPEEMEKLTALEASGYAEKNPKEYSKKWWSIMSPVYVNNPSDTRTFSLLSEFPNEWLGNFMKHLFENIMPSVQALDLQNEQILKCKFPVLTIHGTMDRPSPYGAGREWVFNLPSARLLTVDNGSHMPWVDSPERVFQAIHTFFKGEWPEGTEEIKEVDFR
ncbi:MAG: alpha/beta hydrolase [Desulfobacteraceae bacterium]